MTGKAEQRRPWAVAILLLALIGVALVGPVLIGARDGAPLPGATVQADSRETLAIAAPLVIHAAPRVTIERGNVGLVGENAPASSAGKLFRTLVLGGSSHLMLGGAHVVVDSAPPAAARASEAQALSDPAEPLGLLVAALAELKFRALTVIDTSVSIRSDSGEILALDDVDAEIATDRNGLVKAKGQVRLRGEPLDFEVTVAAHPGRTDDEDAPLRVSARIGGKLFTTSFDGRLTLGERGKITAETADLAIPDLRKAADWLGVTWPQGRGLKQFTAKGGLTLRPRSVSFEHAEITLDGNAATGALTVRAGANRPIIEGTLAFAAFDIAPYMPPAETSALVRASEWALGLRMPGSAEPSFLRATDADLRVSAANLTNGATRLGRLAASLSVKDGKLFGELAELELDQGGKGESQFTVDVTGPEPRFTVRADLDDIDLTMLMAGRAVPSVVEGIADVDFNLAARGASEAEIMETLSGTLSLDMQEGARLGIDVEKLAEAAAATPPRGWGPAGARTTALETFVAQLSAADGVLTAKTVQARGPDRAVSVTGSIDIDKSAVDLVLSLERIEAASGEVSASPAGAFRIRGPWAAPAISPAPPSRDARSATPAANPG